MGFLSELIGAIGILKGAFCVPVPRLVVALFIVFGGGPMSVSGKLMLFRGSSVAFVHSRLSSGGNVAALW
jgi:hypothetical protein